MAQNFSYERKILENSYFKLKNEVSIYTRTQILYNIILIKGDINDATVFKFKQSFYLDIKQFVEAYTSSVSLQAYGYDFIDLDKIFKLYPLLSLAEAASVNKYLTRILRTAGYQEEVDLCKIEGNRLEMLLCKKSKLPLYILKYLLYITSRSLKSLSISVGIVLLLFSIILLPAPCEPMHFFDLTYEHFSSIFIYNHLLNLVYGGMDLSDIFEITPLNPFAVLMLVVGKIILVVIIGNYLLQEIVRKVTE